eukprot:5904942-Ditylum_brightwellii.AAC.1
MHLDLKQSVSTTMSSEYSSDQHRCPLTIAIMFDKVINLSECAIESISINIKNYKISTVPGENIEVVCYSFCYALKCLKNNNLLLLELHSALFKVFQTTSIPEFNCLISQWKNSVDLLHQTQPPYTNFLTKVESCYKNIILSGEW